MANPARGLGEQMAGERKSRLALIGYMVNTREDRPPSRDFSLFRIAAMDETLRNLGAPVSRMVLFVSIGSPNSSSSIPLLNSRRVRRVQVVGVY